MTPATSVHAFDQYVENSGLGLTSLTVRAGINAMLSFYEAVAPMGCIEEYGDMLLFQWGTYDKGDCPLFTINITRQFIESAEIDDDAISQLQLTFEFPPDEEDAGFGAGNRWCRSQSEFDGISRLHSFQCGVPCNGRQRAPRCFGTSRTCLAPLP